jgi:hypothetical protein
VNKPRYTEIVDCTARDYTIAVSKSDVVDASGVRVGVVRIEVRTRAGNRTLYAFELDPSEVVALQSALTNATAINPPPPLDYDAIVAPVDVTFVATPRP